jgi:hypothetical protein
MAALRNKENNILLLPVKLLTLYIFAGIDIRLLNDEYSIDKVSVTEISFVSAYSAINFSFTNC